MHDDQFSGYKVSLRVAQTQWRHPPHSRSPHSLALQELKDDLLDDTAWLLVLQWFNEDH